MTISRKLWGVAASLLVLGGFAIWAAYELSGGADKSNYVATTRLALDNRQTELSRVTREQEAAERVARAALDAATASETEITKKQQVSLQLARETLKARGFVVRVTGPEQIQPGAPNKWRIETPHVDRTAGLPTQVEVTVKDAKDAELFKQTHDHPQGAISLELPTAFWAQVKPGSDLFLEVAAINDDNQKTVLAERIPLSRPTYITHLATDKPLYKPGETIRFRSLTLDRSSLRPVANDMHLSFRLRDPSDAVLPLDEGNGRLLSNLSVVLGPDKKPIRGIGVGEYELASDAAGGEYKLDLFEIAAGKELLLETRKFIVNKYVPDTFEKKLEFDGKSYGPGEYVQARVVVSRTAGGPMKDATANVLATVDGREIHKQDGAKFAIVNEGGTTKVVLNVRFQLPADIFDKAKKDTIPSASLSVNIQDGNDSEPIVRPIPLVTKNLLVEFFPEGGDMIDGLAGRVYFQVRTPLGKPADIKGFITDGTNQLLDVSTETDPENPGVNRGQGVFEFTPKTGTKYFLKLTSPAGIIEPTKDGFRLPTAKADGIAMTTLDAVTDRGSAIRVKLQVSQGPKTLHVGAYTRGRLIGHQRLEVEAGKPVEVKLQGDDVTGGVTRVTVFEEPKAEGAGRAQLIPRAERLVYRKPGEQLMLNVNPDKTRYMPGGKVRLELSAFNEKDTPTPAILMVGVVNQSVITMADNKTDRLMPTHFLLSGEVKHPAELEHADFLLTDHPKAGKTLDLLLGTQGWRRFAEQNGRPLDPADKSDVERMLVAHGQEPSAPVELFKLEQQRLNAEYRPGIEQATLRRGLADRDWKITQDPNVPGLASEVASARTFFRLAEQQHKAAVAELEQFKAKVSEGGQWLLLHGVIFGLVFMAVLSLMSMSATKPAGWRRPFHAGIASVGVCSLVFFVVAGLGKNANMTFSKIGSAIDGGGGGGGEFAASSPPARRTVMLFEASPPRNQVYPENRPSETKSDPTPTKTVSPTSVDAATQKLNSVKAATVGKARVTSRDTKQITSLPMTMTKAAGGFAGVGSIVDVVGSRTVAGKREVITILHRVEIASVNQAPSNAADMSAVSFSLTQEQSSVLALASTRGYNMELLLRHPDGPVNTNYSIDQVKRLLGYTSQLDGFTLSADVQLLRKFLEGPLPFVVREYAHQRDPVLGEVRSDFTETVYWHPVLVLPDSGKATIEFQLSDDIARYQVLVAGHTTDGRIGSITKTIEARKPFSVDPKLPLEISHTDIVDVPVRVTNDSDDRRMVALTVAASGLKVSEPIQAPFDLAPNGKSRRIVRMSADKLEGEASVLVAGTSSGAEADTIHRALRVVPDGFPGVGSFSDTLERRAGGIVVLPKDIVPGSLKVRLEVYPTSMSDLVKGLDGMLREPTGCFEQTSTSNYPNTMILEYMNQTNQTNPQTTMRAKDLLARGYARLTSFECPDTPRRMRQGFEWFGAADRQHEALTAYGLLQFKDMARVAEVDPVLIRRTQEFLLSRRDGTGGFRRGPDGHSFGAAPTHTVDAYIVWALVESDPADTEKLPLTKEIAALKAAAMQDDSVGGTDAYFLALTANILLHRGDRDTAYKLLDRLQHKHTKAGAVTGAVTSITRSGGRDLEIETTAITLLGWLRANQAKYNQTIKEATKWLSQQRGGYGIFGSTQSTIMALKALTLYAQKSGHPSESGEIQVLVGSKTAGTRKFTENDLDVIALDIEKPETIFKSGEVSQVEIVTDAKQPYPFALSCTYTTLTPVSAKDCAVKIETKLSKVTANEGDTVSLAVSLDNLQKQGQGMAVAIIGIPAGMQVPTDMKQLTDHREKQQISYFEIRGRELVLYWREMAPEAKIELHIDLVCTVPGTYRGPASRSYLYYNADHKHWVEPLTIKIAPMADTVAK
ncbi:MAG: alpha-2-macroglobulin [Planctomycetes bacterium]|nr:alpha-2-macroglobulin [Planctomycetota bacterium]